MCGVAGFFRSSSLTAQDLSLMTDALRHRGPDDQGTFHDPSTGTGLGHRRLSILDLSALGRQPMATPDRRLWIVFNGEIYNFVELRADLEERGHSFRTATDTEVVLAAYREWGEAAFRKFNGMWALAIYDAEQQQLLLCRDRFGVKPLYFHAHRGQVVFSSECKALWSIGDKLDLQWDTRGLRTALENSFELEASGQSLIGGVRSLLPGHLLKADGGEPVVRRWWNTLDEQVVVPRSADDKAARFLELFLDSCRIRMRSDVAIGTSLSGGLDSSSVVAALAHLERSGIHTTREASNWRKAFVHVFPGSSLDESAYAKVAAAAAGTDLAFVEADPALMAEELDAVILAHEGIYAGMQDSLWRIYRAQRAAGVVVTLDGHGADEMLGGYDHTLAAAINRESPWSRRFWQLAEARQSIAGHRGRGVMLALRSATLGRPALRRVGRRLGAQALLQRSASTSLLTPDALNLAPYTAVTTVPPAEWPALDQVLYSEFHETTLPRILKNFDLMSMAHGVEVRMPFMDYRLVQYVFSLRAEDKVAEGYTKHVARRAMKGLVPDAIRLRRDKIGFNSPVSQWLRGQLRPWVEEVLDDANGCVGLVDTAGMRRFFREKILTDRSTVGEALRFWAMLGAVRLTQRTGPRKT